MPNVLKLDFGPFTAPARGVLVVFCDEGLKFGPATRRALGGVADIVARAARSERFTGKKKLNLGSCYAGRAQGGPFGRDWRRKGR